MSFKHIIYLKLKADISAEKKSAIINAIEKLRDIEVVQGLEHGENMSPRSQGFNYGFVLDFKSQKDEQEVYQPHPLHMALKELAKDSLEENGASQPFLTLVLGGFFFVLRSNPHPRSVCRPVGI